MSYLVNSGIVILFNVFSTVNKVKYNSFAMIISGVCSVIVTLLFINYTDWDIYAVAGVSSIITICKNLFFTIPVASKLLEYKWYCFYPQVGISILCSGMIIIIGKIVRLILPVNTWVTFFLACGVIGILGLGTNMMIVLNKDERHYLIDLLKRKIFHIG